MIKGLDVAKWQGRPPWTDLRQTQIKFAMAKATHGDLSVDPQYMMNRAMMEHVYPEGRIGEYFWLLPNRSGRDQADYFTKAIEKATNGRGLRPTDLPPTIDFEDSANGSITGQRLIDICVEAKDRLIQNLGRLPILYTGKYFWIQFVEPPKVHVDASALMDMPLFHAQYTKSAAPTLAPPWEKIGWVFWQYDGNLGERMPNGVDADFDRFAGDAKDLDLFIARSHTLIGPPTPPHSLFHPAV